MTKKLEISKNAEWLFLIPIAMIAMIAFAYATRLLE